MTDFSDLLRDLTPTQRRVALRLQEQVDSLRGELAALRSAQAQWDSTNRGILAAYDDLRSHNALHATQMEQAVAAARSYIRSADIANREAASYRRDAERAREFCNEWTTGLDVMRKDLAGVAAALLVVISRRPLEAGLEWKEGERDWLDRQLEKTVGRHGKGNDGADFHHEADPATAMRWPLSGSSTVRDAPGRNP